MSIINNPRIKKLLNCFDTETQEYLLDFCDRISNIDADVFILMARKATCFFDCLEELGLIHFNGYVTSERVLDMNTKWLEDKSIIIIDDAIVSGTSIFKTIEKLKKANVKSIQVHVLTVNEKWFQPDLLKDINNNDYLYHNCNKKPNSSCIELCYNLVNSILIQPRPYDIDFPLYLPIKVSSSKFSHIVNNIGWSCFDVSSTVQKENDVFSLTIIPKKTTLNRLFEFYGIKFNEDSFVKIRIYGSHIKKKKDLYELRIVPMVVLNKLSIQQIENLFNKLITVNNFDFLKKDFISSKSKLRLLQFYFAVKVSEIWIDDINYILNINKNDIISFSERNLSFLFPKDLLYHIETLCKSDNICYFENSYAQIIEPTIENNYDDKNPISLKVKLTQPFLDMYYKKELPCRKIVKELGKEVFENDEYHKLRQRLDEGITFAELKNRIQNYSDLCDTHIAVSLFIDQAVDVGIAVPIIEENNGYLSRAYRHGEDVLFGKREELLYSEMLYCFQKNSNKDNGITHLTVEKLIVLFTRIGLNKKILKPYISNFTINPQDENDKLCNVLRVKTALMGPVGIVGNVKELNKNKNIPYITDETKSMWLTEVFTKRNILSKNANNLYVVNQQDTSSVIENYILETQNFAYIMGELYNEEVDTGITLTDADIVKICSCLTLPSIVQAVSAEVYLFSNNLPSIYLGGKSEKKDLKIFKDYINSLFYESINNAYMKIRAYEEQEALSIIKKVKFEKMLEQNIWKSYFNEEQTHDKNDEIDNLAKEELIALYNEQKTLIYLANICADLIYISLLNNCTLLYKKGKWSNLYSRTARIKKCLGYLKTLSKELTMSFNLQYQQIVDISYRIILSINNKNIISIDLINMLEKLLIFLFKPSNAILEKTTCLVGQHGKVNPFQIYTNCACVTFKYYDENDLKIKINKIKNCFKKAIVDELGTTDDIMMLPEDYNPDMCNDPNIKQLWFVSKKGNSFRRLTKLCLNILYAINSNIKITLMHEIQYQNAVKRNEINRSQFLCSNFYDFIQDFAYSNFLKTENKPTLIYQVSSGYEPFNFKAFMDEINAGSHYDLIDETTIYNLSKRKFKNITYQLKQQEFKEEEKVMENKRIGIITVLPEETSAVIEELGLIKKEAKIGTRTFYEGKLSGDQTEHSVVLTQQLDQGQESVIAAYFALMQKFKPEIIFLVGIAGGIHKDADYCNVVIANEIIGYDKSKDTPNGIKHRGSSHKIDAKLKPYIQTFEQQLSKEDLPSYNGSKYDKINVFHENIGSGSAVIANEVSEITKWLNEYNDKIFAVEMEAYGFSTAFYESELFDNSPTCGVCVIRGISDRADTKKTKMTKYRVPAAHNAAIVLKEFIRHLPKLD